MAIIAEQIKDLSVEGKMAQSSGVRLNLVIDNKILTQQYAIVRLRAADTTSGDGKLKARVVLQNSGATEFYAGLWIEAPCTLVLNVSNFESRPVPNESSVKYAVDGRTICGTEYKITIASEAINPRTTNEIYLRKNTGYIVGAAVTARGIEATKGTRELVKTKTNLTLTEGYLVGNPITRTSVSICDTSTAYYLSTSTTSYYRTRKIVASGTKLTTDDIGSYKYVCAVGTLYSFDKYTPMYLMKTNPGDNCRTKGTEIKYITSSSTVAMYEPGVKIGYNATTSLSGQEICTISTDGYYSTEQTLYEPSTNTIKPINGNPDEGTVLYTNSGTVYGVEGSEGEVFYEAGSNIKTISSDAPNRVYTPTDYNVTILSDTYEAGATEYYKPGSTGLSTTETKTIYEPKN